MGSSKIVFVGAVAVIIGLFGFGIKTAQQKSADIAANQAYMLMAKGLAEEGLQAAARKLPRTASSVVPSSVTQTTSNGTRAYSVSTQGMPATQVKIISYGICKSQRATYTSVLTEFTGAPKPSEFKSWNGWKLVSSIRTYETIE